MISSQRKPRHFSTSLSIVAALASALFLASIFAQRERLTRAYYWFCANFVHGCNSSRRSSEFGLASGVQAVVYVPGSNTSKGIYAVEHPVESDALVDSIGVDTHFNYPGSPYETRWPVVSAALISSGIRHIRDGNVSLAGYGPRLTILGKAGIHHNIGFEITASAAQVNSALATQSPYVEFVETANEFDAVSKKDPDWASDIADAQEALYKAVRSVTANASVAVLAPSMAAPVHYTSLGNLDAVSDFGNLHDYMCNDYPGTSNYDSIQAITALVRTSTKKPIWTTETGYSDNALRRCGIPDSLIAKYDPRLIAENFIAGEPRTYFYELTDEPSDEVGGALGLLYATGQAKPQFTALVSMIGLLRDQGPHFSTSPLSYALSGSTQNVHHLLLQKRDGTYVLMLWLEESGWKPKAGDIGGELSPVSAQSVVVSTKTKHTDALVFSYDSAWKLKPSALPQSSASYTLPIGDAITFLTFK